MKKEFFHSLGQENIRVVCHRSNSEPISKYEMTIGDIVFDFLGRDRKDEILVEYPIENSETLRRFERIYIRNDNEFERLILSLVELQYYLKGSPRHFSSETAMQYTKTDNALKNVIEYCYAKGAMYYKNMNEISYYGHSEETYEPDKQFVAFWKDDGLESWLTGLQIASVDELEEPEYCYVFPNAKDVKIQKDVIRIGRDAINMIYVILDNEEYHVHYPIRIQYGNGATNSFYKEQSFKKEVFRLMQEAEGKAKQQQLSLYAYNLFILLGLKKPITKEEIVKNDMLQVESFLAYMAQNNTIVQQYNTTHYKLSDYPYGKHYCLHVKYHVKGSTSHVHFPLLLEQSEGGHVQIETLEELWDAMDGLIVLSSALKRNELQNSFGEEAFRYEEENQVS